MVPWLSCHVSVIHEASCVTHSFLGPKVDWQSSVYQSGIQLKSLTVTSTDDQHIDGRSSSRLDRGNGDLAILGRDGSGGARGIVSDSGQTTGQLAEW